MLLNPAQLRNLSTPPTVHALCPGYRVARWASPATLSPPCRERLHQTLRELAARAFDADHDAYWRARVEAGFFDHVSTLALILGPDGSPVGWGGYHRLRLAHQRALYLDAAGVLPEHRRAGLSSTLTTHFLAREVLAHPLEPTFVVLRTRHPAVYAGWRRSLGARRVFPNELRPLPARVRRVAEETAQWLGDGPRLDPATLLVREAYRMFDGCVYGTPPRSGHGPLDDYFTQRVGPRDAVLVVARMSAPVLVRTSAGRIVRTWTRAARGSRSTGRPRGAAPAGAGTSGLSPGARP